MREGLQSIADNILMLMGATTAAVEAPSTPKRKMPATPGLDNWLKCLTWPVPPSPHAYAGPGEPWLAGNEHYDVLDCCYHAEDAIKAFGLPPVDWSQPKATALDRYRDRSVLKGGVPAYESFSNGLARHYLETKDPKSLEAVRRLATTETLERLASEYRHLGSTREAALILLNCLSWTKCGLGVHPAELIAASLVIGHMERWAEGPSKRPYGFFVKPFMAAISCRAAIDWMNFHAAETNAAVKALIARIPAAINGTLDYLWTKCWHPQGTFTINGDPWPGGAITYQDVDSSDPRLSPITGLVTGAVIDRISFRGPDSLSKVDNFYQFCRVTWDTGPLANNDSYLITDYHGPARLFVLSTNYSPQTSPRPGDIFRIRSFAGDGDTRIPAPDLNQLVAPAFAWAEMHERNTVGNTPRADELRNRYEAMFAGGTMAIAPPTGQKQWNQSLWWGLDGLQCRAESAAKVEAPSTSEPEPPPVKPPVVASRTVTFGGTFRMEFVLPEKAGGETSLNIALKAAPSPAADGP